MDIPYSCLPAIINRCAPLCAIAALCVMSGTAQAAGSATTPIAAIHILKTQLVRLRDITLSSFTPSVYGTSKSAEYTSLQLNAEGRLFKPLRAEAYVNARNQSVSQPLGVQISDRTQLHCDFTRYHTADDQREISLKVGINVGFR